jgi:hypothetical protein
MQSIYKEWLGVHFSISSDITNGDRMFRGVCAECLEVTAVTEIVQGQLRVSRKLEE